VTRVLILAHLAGTSLALGALVSQLVLLERHKSASDALERAGSERMAATVIVWVQAPGVYLTLASGLALLWRLRWEPLAQGSFQFKLLFVVWTVLATHLMRRTTDQLRTLREQCGSDDSDRLRALKDNHGMIGIVTAVIFLFILALSIWRPF